MCVCVFIFPRIFSPSFPSYRFHSLLSISPSDSTVIYCKSPKKIGLIRIPLFPSILFLVCLIRFSSVLPFLTIALSYPLSCLLAFQILKWLFSLSLSPVSHLLLIHWFTLVNLLALSVAVLLSHQLSLSVSGLLLGKQAAGATFFVKFLLASCSSMHTFRGHSSIFITMTSFFVHQDDAPTAPIMLSML